MKVALYLDTSVIGFGIILKEIGGEEKILFRSFDASKSASSFKLSSLLKENLKGLNLKGRDIDTVVVSKGPGSFTGVRVGLSWVEGFCAVEGQRKLIAVSSLGYLARYLSKLYKMDSVSVVLANTKTSGFLASYTKGESCTFSFLSEEGDLEKRLGKNQKLFVDETYDILEKKSVFKFFTKEKLSILCLEALVDGVNLSDLNHRVKGAYVDPLYLRKSSVEEKIS